MKVAISITVDYEYLALAKTKVSNISEYLNMCLASLAEQTESPKSNIESEIVETQKILAEQSSKLSSLNSQKKLLANKEIQEKKLLEEKELKRRWKCPVCKTFNSLELERCSKCFLPTRHDSKTIEVYLE